MQKVAVPKFLWYDHFLIYHIHHTINKILYRMPKQFGEHSPANTLATPEVKVFHEAMPCSEAARRSDFGSPTNTLHREGFVTDRLRLCTKNLAALRRISSVNAAEPKATKGLERRNSLKSLVLYRVEIHYLKYCTPDSNNFRSCSP